MTNETIIFNERVRLMEEGILKSTGKKIIVECADGKKEIEVPEDIHTFNGWKERGYSVKKGEKSQIKISIWKYTVKKIETENKDGNAEESEQSKMFMKLSAFFTPSQVEPMKARA